MAFGISLPALEKTVEIGVMHVAFWVIGLVVVLMLCMCGFGLEFIYHGGLQRIRNKNRQSSATPADGLSQVEEGGAEEVNALRPLGTSLFRHTSPRNKKQTQTAGASSKVKSRSFTGSSKSKSSSRAVKPNGPSTPGGSFDLALHLAQLKELLAKDDEARAAEEIELSRLSNYSWNETSTPAANEVMKNAIATTHELEAATVAAELHRRIKTAIKGHESVLEELFFSNESGAAQGGEGEADTPSPRPLVVDPERFRSDGDYRQHALACTALVERFGRGNVERTLREVQRRKQELRGQDSRQSCRGSPGGGGGGGRSSRSSSRGGGGRSRGRSGSIGSFPRSPNTGGSSLSRGSVSRGSSMDQRSQSSKDTGINNDRIRRGSVDAPMDVTASFQSLSFSERGEVLRGLPVSVFQDHPHLSLLGIKRRTFGRPPQDMVECLRSVPSMADRASLLELDGALSAQQVAFVLVELRLRGDFGLVLESLGREVKAAVVAELKGKARRGAAAGNNGNSGENGSSRRSQDIAIEQVKAGKRSWTSKFEKPKPWSLGRKLLSSPTDSPVDVVEGEGALASVPRPPPIETSALSGDDDDDNDDNDDNSNAETPSVRSHAPPHPIHPDLPLDVPHKLVGCGSAAALGLLLHSLEEEEEGTSCNQSVLLLLEVHRRGGSAGKVLEHLAANHMHGFAASMLAEVSPRERARLLQGMAVQARGKVFTALGLVREELQLEALSAMKQRARVETLDACEFGGDDDEGLSDGSDADEGGTGGERDEVDGSVVLNFGRGDGGGGGASGGKQTKSRALAKKLQRKQRVRLRLEELLATYDEARQAKRDSKRQARGGGQDRGSRSQVKTKGNGLGSSGGGSSPTNPSSTQRRPSSLLSHLTSLTSASTFTVSSTAVLSTAASQDDDDFDWQLSRESLASSRGSSKGGGGKAKDQRKRSPVKRRGSGGGLVSNFSHLREYSGEQHGNQDESNGGENERNGEKTKKQKSPKKKRRDKKKHSSPSRGRVSRSLSPRGRGGEGPSSPLRQSEEQGQEGEEVEDDDEDLPSFHYMSRRLDSLKKAPKKRSPRNQKRNESGGSNGVDETRRVRVPSGGVGKQDGGGGFIIDLDGARVRDVTKKKKQSKGQGLDNDGGDDEGDDGSDGLHGDDTFLFGPSAELHPNHLTMLSSPNQTLGSSAANTAVSPEQSSLSLVSPIQPRQHHTPSTSASSLSTLRKPTSSEPAAKKTQRKQRHTFPSADASPARSSSRKEGSSKETRVNGGSKRGASPFNGRDESEHRYTPAAASSASSSAATAEEAAYQEMLQLDTPGEPPSPNHSASSSSFRKKLPPSAGGGSGKGPRGSKEGKELAASVKRLSSSSSASSSTSASKGQRKSKTDSTQLSASLEDNTTNPAGLGGCGRRHGVESEELYVAVDRSESLDSPSATEPRMLGFKRTGSRQNSGVADALTQGGGGGSGSLGGLVSDCRGKHGLDDFYTPEEGWYCSECHLSDDQCERFAVGMPMWGCRLCDYDLCYSCFTNPTACHTAALHRQPSSSSSASSSFSCSSVPSVTLSSAPSSASTATPEEVGAFGAAAAAGTATTAAAAALEALSEPEVDNHGASKLGDNSATKEAPGLRSGPQKLYVKRSTGASFSSDNEPGNPRSSIDVGEGGGGSGGGGSFKDSSGGNLGTSFDVGGGGRGDSFKEGGGSFKEGSSAAVAAGGQESVSGRGGRGRGGKGGRSPRLSAGRGGRGRSPRVRPTSFLSRSSSALESDAKVGGGEAGVAAI